MVDAQVLAYTVVEGLKAIGRAGEFEGKTIPRRLSGKRGSFDIGSSACEVRNSLLDWTTPNTEPPILLTPPS